MADERGTSPESLFSPDRTTVRFRVLGFGTVVFTCLVLMWGLFLLVLVLLGPALGWNTWSRRSFLPLMIGAFLAYMGARGLGQGGVSIDRETRTLVRWWWVPPGMKRQRAIAWEHIREVVVGQRMATRSMPVSRSCDVLVVVEHGEAVRVKHTGGRDRAIAFAQELADYLGVPARYEQV